MTMHSREELGGAAQLARRAMMKYWSQSILTTQRETAADRSVRGPRWVSRVTFLAPPEDDARRVLLDATADLGNGRQRYNVPTLAPVRAEWVGPRPGLPDDAPEPSGMTEQDKYEALTQGASRDMTIMYMYGGAHFMNGPASRRAVATTLSQLTSSRCIIIQHRLAPQFAFPSQPLDVLHAYLSLLYPPPGSFHAPVEASSLVLAGESSGVQLALSMIQTILSFHRRCAELKSPPTINFQGRRVPIPLPAGVAGVSPGLDHLGSCLPSWQGNAAFDVFVDRTPDLEPRFPRDAAWPTTPPREHLYTEAPTLAHPLVSPICARDWTGAPPLYLASGGGEMSLDAAKVVAQRAAECGVTVIWEEYEAMFHNWTFILRGWPQSETCFKSWARACVRFATKGGSTSGNETNGVCIYQMDGRSERRPVSVLQLTPLSHDDVLHMVGESITRLKIMASNYYANMDAGKL